MKTLSWTNPWLQFPELFYQRVEPTPLVEPHFVHCNEKAAHLLGLNVEHVSNEMALRCFNGEQLLHGMQPIATVYGGHQFGIYTSQLGDGRAILLGETRGMDGESYEIQLKGAGLTPYSRTLNGRSTLGSAIREYLGGEALTALGIPSTRALGLLSGRTEIPGEGKAAILVRMARSHTRFGHFEYFHHREAFDALQHLFEVVIARDFPALLDEPVQRRALRFLTLVTDRTARLIARWQSVGFTHGVMNTDNMTVSGETLDFGPYGFMESYDPGYNPNPGDDQNRYPFDQQADIGRWNCLALAQAMTSLLPRPVVPAGLLRRYRQTYQQHYLYCMRLKLGLQTEHVGDAGLIDNLLPLLARTGSDYPLFFRNLADWDGAAKQRSNALAEIFHPMLQPWFEAYRNRLGLEKRCQAQRRDQMNRVNPCYVLRQHLLERTLACAGQGDFSELARLLPLIQNPFQVQAGMENYALPYADTSLYRASVRHV